jgi:hypothetical protein
MEYVGFFGATIIYLMLVLVVPYYLIKKKVKWYIILSLAPIPYFFISSFTALLLTDYLRSDWFRCVLYGWRLDFGMMVVLGFIRLIIPLIILMCIGAVVWIYNLYLKYKLPAQ